MPPARKANEPRGFFNRGGVWVAVQFVLMAVVLVFGVVFRGDVAGMAMPIMGTVLFIAGGWIGIAGVLALGSNRTPYPRPLEGSNLVQDGIYGWVRHPLYTSVILISAGWGMIWESGPSLVTALVLIPFFHFKAKHEERWLLTRFPAYADYIKRVPGFIPNLRARSRRD